MRITGVKDGSGLTARHIVAGSPGTQAAGRGWDQGPGNALGKHLGNGRWKDKAAGPNA